MFMHLQKLALTVNEMKMQKRVKVYSIPVSVQCVLVLTTRRQSLSSVSLVTTLLSAADAQSPVSAAEASSQLT